MNKNLKTLFFKISDVTSKLNTLIPKKRDRIVIYSNWGFRDNIRTLYQYLVDNGYQDKYEIVCASNNFYHLKKDNKVKFVSIYNGLYYFLTSKYFFYSFGKYPIKPTKKQMVVNLWHGMPLKKIGNLENGMENIDYNFFTKLVSSSDLFTPIMKAAFNANIFSLDDLEFKRINNLLAGYEYHLYIKLHPLEESHFKFKNNYSNIHMLSEDIISQNYGTLYKFLGTTSALITDYSSVFLDYYLLNRPVAFTINDYEEYKEKRGFVFEDVKSLMVGPTISNFDELLKFLLSVMKSEDEFYIERNKVNSVVNSIQKDFTKTLLENIGIEK